MGDQGGFPQSHRPPSPLKERYDLLEQVGQGGMALVYRAHDTVLGREVAIKFLNPNRLLDPRSLDRFMREARAVARLSHPHIMSLYDVDQDGAWNYLVLEYIPGRDLAAVLVARGQVFAPDEAIAIMRSMLSALAYAHGQGIIHRDVKPRNIMLTPEGLVKVADFGLALVQQEVQLTQEGMVLGTMLYMPPEMVLSQPIDHRADLYSAGVVFYELLTGNPPFTGHLNAGLISQILNAPIPRVRAINPLIPEKLEQFISRLLAKQPTERFASAEEALLVLQALQAEISSTPLSARSQDAEAMPALTLYAAQEEAVYAVEAERRRLAGLLDATVIAQLDLLLSQAALYEQSLTGNPQAKTVASVLASLARQCLQQVRDLGANLNPAVLENLGLEPAIETLVSQAMRTYGIHVNLTLARLRERLPATVELALFRVAQDFMERAVKQAQATQLTLRLEHRDEQVVFLLADNGRSVGGVEALALSRQRIQQLGGRFATGTAATGGLELSIVFKLEPSVEMTARELEVLQLLVEGLSNKEIARTLSISPRTVNFHLDNVYSKLGVSTRTEAAIYALRQGWVRRPSSDTSQINR